jgi:hypothetical protein
MASFAVPDDAALAALTAAQNNQPIQLAANNGR